MHMIKVLLVFFKLGFLLLEVAGQPSGFYRRNSW